MTDLQLIADIVICACTGVGFFYGLLRCFDEKHPLFLKAIIGAMGSMMEGRLFAAVLRICGGQSVNRLNLGYIGLIGCFLFLFSAGSEINEKIHTTPSRKIWLIYLVAFVPIIILVWMIIAAKVSVPYKIVGCLVALLVLGNGITFFKFMILPDEGNGFLTMLRPSSVILLIFSYSQLGEIYFSIRGNTVLLIITDALICSIGLIIVPLTERRIKNG